MTIELSALVKSFGRQTVVHNLSMTIEDGGLTVLLGPSGCGKTTTLRMIAGLEQCDSGKIILDENDVTRLSPKERGVAMVFQDYGLYPHMSVLQNVAFPLKIAGIARSEREKSAYEMLKRLRIDQLAAQRPGKISGGEKQRVSLARALVRKPSILLMDEPLSNLDAMLRVSMRAEIKQLHQEFRTTTLYVTHDQIEAMSLGTAIAVMSNGRVEQYGAPSEIYHRPASLFVGLFVGSPSMNLFHLALEQTSDKTCLTAENVRIPVDDEVGSRLGSASKAGEVIAGVRPEDLVIEPGGETGGDGIVGTIQFIEHLGQDNYIHVGVGGSLIIGRFSSDQNFEIGQTVRLLPKQSKVHFFDPQTEKAIG